METGTLAPLIPNGPITRWQLRHWAGPAHPVAHRLREGDTVGGFTVLETPGHSPGHISFWRDQDRVLVLGDLLFNLHPLTGRPGLREPPATFTLDPRQNREAAGKIAALEPRLVCFGHGPPLTDGTKLVDFVARLPADATSRVPESPPHPRLHAKGRGVDNVVCAMSGSAHVTRSSGPCLPRA
jgi:hydroxyacylglutathione hydrolase